MQHRLIGRGKNGWHSDGLSDGNNCSSSGGTLEGYLKEAEDGTPVYDAYEADMGSFVQFIMNSPIADPSLGPGEINKFDSKDKACLLGMLPGLEGSFKSLAVMTLADIGSMDLVAVDVYLTMLREKVPGVKIGQVQSGQVVWESP